MSALLHLALWQLKNALRDALTNPRKLIPLALAAVWFIGFGFLVTHAQGEAAAPQATLLSDFARTHRAEAHAVIFLLLSLFIAATLDRGFVGGTLRYSASDTDYLFLAPFPSRLVLGFRLLAPAPGLLLVVLYNVSFPPAGPALSALPAWTAMAAIFACVGGYQNLSVALDLVYGLGRSVLLRRFYLGAVTLLVAYAIFLSRRHGIAGLTGTVEHGLLPFLFYPCRLTADVALATSAGKGWLVGGQLALFYLLTLVLVLAPSVNFHEAATGATERVTQMQQALSDGQWWFRPAASRHPRVPMSLPPLGRGIWAIVWAHLSAAAKNPLGNFAAPTLFGIGLAIAALHTPASAEEGGLLVAIAAFYYLMGTTIGGGIFYFRRALLREPLIRPLPLRADLVVLAEVLPRVLLAAPFYVACALLLLVFGGSAFTLSACILLCLPLVSLCLTLLQYTIALSYPSLEDKLQAAIAQGVQLLLAALLTPILALFLAIPLILGMPPVPACLIFAAGCGFLSLLLWRAATRAYLAYPPDGTFMLLTKTNAKRLIKPLLIAAVLLGLGLTVGLRVNKSLHKPPPPPRTVQTHLGDIVIQVSETGTIEPADKVDVKSKAAGRLLSIPIQEGQYVTKGQLIATVDRSLIDPALTGDEAQLRQAQARLDQARAGYALQVKQTAAAIVQAQAGLNTAQAHLAAVAAGARPQELDQQKEAVSRAQIAHDDAVRTQKRRQSLLGKGFISQADYDASQVAVDTAASSLATAKQALLLTQAGPRIQDVNDARAQVAAARAQLDAARANEGQDAVKQSDIAQARASVAQISGNIQQLQVNISDTRIIAPASGIVLKKYKQPNEIVQSATTGFSDAQAIVATLGSRLEVKVGINEVDISKVHAHAPARITVDALPDTTFVGTVTEIAPASTNAFDTSGGSSTSSISKFSVKVGFARYDPRLRSGMSANVAIVSQKHAHVILAPLEAIPFPGTQGQVTVLTGLGKPEKRTVITGLRNDSDVEIISGLHAGEKLIVSPLDGTARRKTDFNGGG